MRWNPFEIFCISLVCLNLPLSAETDTHWAYRELLRPKVPEIEGVDQGKNSIDQFILSKLQETELNPVPGAEKETLIRRVTLDLTGLPPTPEEIDAFLADTESGAWERLVDRLLDSPHYGERWGRHWLDLARYVQGSVKVPGVDRIDVAEPYRDYVVRSFNADKPWDQFITEQLAGDLLPPSENYLDQIVAPAFLSIGPWFDECTDPRQLRLDLIDEQIGTLTQAFLGLNFSCARCHDHKVDPIPETDYYALAGIFRSTRITERFSEFWKDGRPRLVQPLAKPDEVATNRKVQERIAELRQERWEILKSMRDELVTEVQERKDQYKLAADFLRAPNDVTFEAEDYDGEKNIRIETVGDFKVVETQMKLDQWVRYRVEVPAAGQWELHIRHAAAEPSPVKLTINDDVVEEGILAEPTGGMEEGAFAWESYGPFDLESGKLTVRLDVDRHQTMPRLDRFVLRRVSPESQRQLKAVASKHALKPDVVRALSFDPPHWPPTVPEVEAYLTSGSTQKVAELDQRVEELQAEMEQFPMTLAVMDGEVQDLTLHKGGDASQPLEQVVPRGVPSLASDFVPQPEIPEGESGRLQLAEWMTHPKHPLTSRAMVNRVWHWHFGSGLSSTVDDLGLNGEDPSHPELLDWLAVEFVESGWSVQHLHRLILTSDTYQRRSTETPRRNLAVDPDNRLLWRFQPRRLEVEAIYDSMLTASGKVPRQPSGQPLDTNRSKDRALYILTSARSPMGMGLEIRKMFPLFGFDESRIPMHRRDRSSTAAQSLWWLNNPLPRHYAEKLAERLLKEADTEESRIRLAYRLTLGTDPSVSIIDSSARYLQHCQTNLNLSKEESWARLCLGIFSSDAFSTLN